ncbi:nitrogen regulatory protein P-II family /ammonium transporter [Carnobacterium alterfunditum]|uniref:Nitrogen regulatory protein P-II family /ammonium transporter n=1 Tax=Carnobacterium alterfunditum TaxID=28230 RepID=A0A1N6HUP0_9LACT|nr:ammonium transporter [Carnobacterium alterfunditum]SIO23375.1 nitrogen regulatory protein P-II family /ammonium transporter [Carnobacterium alterfunditum]
MFSSVDTLWVIVGTVLVFFMQAGFAMVETGFTRAKNAGNIIMKNLMDFVLGSLMYWIIGFGIMFGPSIAGLIGTPDLFVQGNYDTTIPGYVFLMFQTVFAATAATIVSGAMAERTKFSAYLVYTLIISTIVYPISGHWIWGGGWLAQLGFVDFAGSTAVHMVGGVTALIGAKIVGARIGKYDKEGKVKAIPGHSLTLGALGVFILWFAWFGFNGASTVSATGDESLTLIGKILLNTNLSAAAATLAAMIITWTKYGKPDISMTLNGSLAGLVGITAGCAIVSPFGAVAIGALSAIALVYGIEFVEKKAKIDDPVGAFGVHGISGALGTILVGIFATDEGLFYGGGFNLLGIQVLGVVSVIIWVSVTMIITFKLVDRTIGLRVTPEEEIVGMDISEHGLESSYGDFVTVPFGQKPVFQGVKFENEGPGLAFAGMDPIPISNPTVEFQQRSVHASASDAPKEEEDTTLMKVDIITNETKFEDLKKALNTIGITGMTVTKVQGYGMQKGQTAYYRGVEIEANLLPKIRLEIVVSKIPVSLIIETARQALYTGTVGDGKIFVYNVENVVRVSSGVQGFKALEYDEEKIK